MQMQAEEIALSITQGAAMSEAAIQRTAIYCQAMNEVLQLDADMINEFYNLEEKEESDE